MAGSVRNYAVLYFGAGRSRGGGVAVGGGNVLSSTPTHKLDGVEHAAADDTSRLDATVDRHGLLPKLSGDVADGLRGDGTFGGFDHGGLSGLGDDDHPQYTTDAEATTIAALVASAYAQPLDADLTAFAGLSIAADKLPYGTGAHTLGLTDLTAAGRALIDDATAGDQRTTLGLGTMAVEAKTITTQDDLLVGGSAGALARLAKGADGQVLTVDPATHHLVWATPAGGSSALTVEEVDGSPTDSAVTKIVFPNGTLGIASHVATYTPAGGGGGDTSGEIGAGFDGGASNLVALKTQDVVVPFTGTITGWTLLGDASGSTTIGISKCTYAGFPGSLTSITAAAPPTMSAAQKATSSTLTGWTTAVTAADVLRFTLSSVSGLRQLVVVLTYSRP